MNILIFLSSQAELKYFVACAFSVYSQIGSVLYLPVLTMVELGS